VDTDRLRALWDRAQRGWPRDFPLVQFPNAPLLVAIAAWVVAKLTSGAAHDASRAVFTAALATWAVLELARGSNWVRRVLGAVVLASIAAGLIRSLG
jgi:hypothetical protein